MFPLIEQVSITIWAFTRSNIFGSNRIVSLAGIARITRSVFSIAFSNMPISSTNPMCNAVCACKLFESTPMI